MVFSTKIMSKLAIVAPKNIKNITSHNKTILNRSETLNQKKCNYMNKKKNMPTKWRMLSRKYYLSIQFELK